MKKKLLAVMLALCMALTLLPVGAMAVDTDTAIAWTDAIKQDADPIIVKVEGNTYTVQKSFKLSGIVWINEDMTLDLNGCTITAPDDGDEAFKVTSGKTLTIMDGKATTDGEESGGKITANANVSGKSTYGVIAADEKSNIVLNSGTIEAALPTGVDAISYGRYGIGVFSGATITVNGGKVVTKGCGSCIGGNNTLGHMNIYVKGGTLSTYIGPAIYMPNQVTLSVESGTIDGGIGLRMGQVTISGGSIIGQTSTGKGYIDSPDTGGSCLWTGDGIYLLAGTYNELTGYSDGNSCNITISGNAKISATQGNGVAIYARPNGNQAAKVDQKVSLKISDGVEITGGRTDKKALVIESHDKVNMTKEITGGTFSSSPEEYLSATHKVTSSESEGKTTYTVAEAKGLSVEKPDDGNPQITGTFQQNQGSITGDEGEGSNTGTVTNNEVTVTLPTSTGVDEGVAVDIPVETAATMDKVTSLTIQSTDEGGGSNASVSVKLDTAAMTKVAGEASDATAGTKITVEVKAATPDSSLKDVKSAYEVNVDKKDSSGKSENLFPSGDTKNGTITITVPKPTSDKSAFWPVILVANKIVEVLDKVTADENGNLAIPLRHLSTVGLVDSDTKPDVAEASWTGGAGTLAEAITAANQNAGSGSFVINLNKDVEITSGMSEITKDVTINGNGHSITAKADETTKAFKPIEVTKSDSTTDKHYAMFLVTKADAKDGKLTLNNVTLNGSGLTRVVRSNGEVTINEGTKITGGKGTGASGSGSYIGGMYVNGGKFTMTGGEITGNTVGTDYADDGYLEYSSDLWIGDKATATISGGTVGKAFINAAPITNPTGGNLNMTGGTISEAFVEADTNHTGEIVAVKDNASIEDVLVAMDYVTDDNEDTRMIVSLGNVDAENGNKSIEGLSVPEGMNATVVEHGKASEGKTYTMANKITIGKGATLTIPEGITVKAAKADSGAPEITNNGTLQVNGSLIAGDSDESSDTTYLDIKGTGTIQAGPNAKVDVKADENPTITITLNPNGGTLTGANKITLYTQTEADGSKKDVAIGTLPADPTRPNYRFEGWYTDTSFSTKVEATTTFDADTTIYAKWQYTGGGGGGYVPPTPTNTITAPTAANGKVALNTATAKQGDTVTITVTPDEGYELDKLTVTDANGKTVPVTKGADGKYTFTMPATAVKVEASFKAKSVEPELPFTDVKEGDWFYDAVKYVYDNGMMNGVGDRKFDPMGTTNRAMIVTMIYRLEGEPSAPASTFQDVPADQWYTKAVDWAASTGIVKGISSEKFGPMDNVTREQMVTMLHRYAEYKGYDVTASKDISGFTDASGVSAYALPAMRWAVAEGLIKGMGDNTLSPDGIANRDEVATIFMRFCENIAK